MTPPVIVTLPCDGIDEGSVRANAWMIKQTLAAGVHGLLLCHAETPAAVKAFVEAARYPFQATGVDAGWIRAGAAPAARRWRRRSGGWPGRLPGPSRRLALNPEAS